MVQLPGSTVVADLAFYKDGQLALLLAPTSAGGGGGGQGGCRLLLLSQDRLQYVQLPGELLADCDAQQLCQMMLEGAGLAAAGRSLLDDCRQRRLPYPRVQRPLAVSASRGVGCVLAGTQVRAWAHANLCGWLLLHHSRVQDGVPPTSLRRTPWDLNLPRCALLAFVL